MLHLITAFLAAIRVFCRNRVDTSIEVLALRQQVAVLKRKRPRPSMNLLDRFFGFGLTKYTRLEMCSRSAALLNVCQNQTRFWLRTPGDWADRKLSI